MKSGHRSQDEGVRPKSSRLVMTISQLTSTVAETVAETVVLTTNPEDGNARREESTQDGYHTAITMAREVMDTGRSRKELRVAVLLCATRVSIINWQGGGHHCL